MIKVNPKKPKVILIVGRRGSGKTYSAKKIMQEFRKSGGLVFAVDPIASDPPEESHLAFSSDVWDCEVPENIPENIGLVAVDESDIFAPQAEARRRPPPPLVDLIRRGRHRGVTLVLCTQRPALVMRDAFALADFVVVCKTTDARDIKSLCELSGVSEHSEKIISAKNPGPVLVWEPPPIGVTIFQGGKK